MSEYQYYEFTAVDAPLTREQQAELRARSSRATITSSSFSNEYHWGDLKGDPQEWMARYFDAHVHSASWGECRFMLRLPNDVLDGRMAQDFSGSAQRAHGDYGGVAFSLLPVERGWLLDWALNLEECEDERFWSQEDGPGWMGRLLPLRDEVLRGDLRALYLGWLARLCSGELDDDDLEPPVPPGLGALTPAQEALAEFLMLDPDLLAVAAAGSADLKPAAAAGTHAAWIAQLPAAELRAAVAAVMAGQGRTLERGLLAQYAAWRAQDGAPQAGAARRSVKQIEAGREAAEQLRLVRERTEVQAREAARQAEHARHLEDVAGRADAIWRKMDRLLHLGTGSAYGKAQDAVVELAAALRAAGREADFRHGLSRQLSAHGARPAWIKRLDKAGLL